MLFRQALFLLRKFSKAYPVVGRHVRAGCQISRYVVARWLMETGSWQHLMI